MHLPDRLVRVVLQSRLSSTRLPAKALLPLAGIALAELCARRLANRGADVVVAIPSGDDQEPLALLLTGRGLKVYRGSELDVLDRFVGATADMRDDDIVVRCTADNPLPDGSLIESLVRCFELQACDYLTSDYASGLPYGVTAEVTCVRWLREAASGVLTAEEREHVTPWIRRNRRVGRLTARGVGNLADLSHLRCTIDTFDDYQRMARVFSKAADPVAVAWPVLVESARLLKNAPAFRIPYAGRRESEGAMALGTAQLGSDYGVTNRDGCPTATAAVEMVQFAVDHGVTWLDTAPAYGQAERRIGEALRGSWGDRSKIVSKVFLDDACDRGPTEVEARAKLSVLRSLRALRRERLDVLLLHRWQERELTHGAIWSALLECKADGLVGQLGASFEDPGQLVQALEDPNVEHVQIPLNLLDRRWLEPDVQAAIQRRPDVRVHARSVFLQGLLAQADIQFSPRWDAGALLRIEQMRTLARAFGRVNAADLCIAFVRALPWVDSVVIGADSRIQLSENLNLIRRPPLMAEEVNVVLRTIPAGSPRLVAPSKW